MQEHSKAVVSVESGLAGGGYSLRESGGQWSLWFCTHEVYIVSVNDSSSLLFLILIVCVDNRNIKTTC